MHSEGSHSDQDSEASHSSKKKRSLSGRPVRMAQEVQHLDSSDPDAFWPVETYAKDISKDISSLSSRINIIDRQMIDSDQKYSALTSSVIKLTKSYQTMYSSMIDLQRRSMGNNILLSNIGERNSDNLIEACRQKLVEMGVNPARTDIERAHRTGPSINHRPRQVVARLLRQDDAHHILEATKPPRGAPYNPQQVRVTPQIPTSLRYARTRAYDIAQTARECDPYAEVYVMGEKVYIDNEISQDPVEPPTIDEKLLMSKADKLMASRTKFFSSQVISENHSQFQLYSAEIHSTLDAKIAYRAISLDPMASSSTHMISAYWMENDRSGYYDDHDHGLGKHLLRVMQETEMVNSICFLTREYGGEHLGYRRYEIISELVDDIYEKVQRGQQPSCLNIFKKRRIGNTGDIYDELLDIDSQPTYRTPIPYQEKVIEGLNLQTNETPIGSQITSQPLGNQPNISNQSNEDIPDNPNASTPRSTSGHEQQDQYAEDWQSDQDEDNWALIRGKDEIRRGRRRMRDRGIRERGSDSSRSRGRGGDFHTMRGGRNDRGRGYNSRRGRGYGRNAWFDNHRGRNTEYGSQRGQGYNGVRGRGYSYTDHEGRDNSNHRGQNNGYENQRGRGYKHERGRSYNSTVTSSHNATQLEWQQRDRGVSTTNDQQGAPRKPLPLQPLPSLPPHLTGNYGGARNKVPSRNTGQPAKYQTKVDAWLKTKPEQLYEETGYQFHYKTQPRDAKSNNDTGFEEDLNNTLIANPAVQANGPDIPQLTPKSVGITQGDTAPGTTTTDTSQQNKSDTSNVIKVNDPISADNPMDTSTDKGTSKAQNG